MSTPARLSGRQALLTQASAVVHLAVLDLRSELGGCDEGVQPIGDRPRAPWRRRRSRRSRGWRDQADAPIAGGGGCEARLRRHHADDGQAPLELGPERRQRGGGGRVAGHHEQPAPRASRMPASCCEKASSSSGVRSPYGKRAVSPR